MRLRLALIVLLLLLPVPSFAQAIIATPTSKMAVDVAAGVGWPAPIDLPTANALVFRYYLDGATAGVAMTGGVCAGTTTVTCTFPIPAFAAGSHTVTVTATVTALGAIGESPKSATVTFTMVKSAPGAPLIRFVAGP